MTEPAAPAPVPPAPYDLRARGPGARWEANGPDVLHGLDLEVPAGQRVAVVGPSGCGKTTLAMVLLRFLDPAAGTVTLGGTDIMALASGTVRRIIGLCAQVVILDEPAEHLDDDTARELTRDLLAATEGRTRLLITHRPVGAAEVDQIVPLGGTPSQTAAGAQALVPTGPVAAAV